GLYYNWQRYYDPKLGRYTQTDPEGEGLNLYSYVFNNPCGFIDPTGTHMATNALQSLVNAIGGNWLGDFIGGGLLGATGYLAGLMQSVLGETITQAIFGGLYGNDAFMFGKGVGNIVGNIEIVLGVGGALYKGAAGLLRGAGVVEDGTVIVRHYTDSFGRGAITQSGELRSGTYVTLPTEIRTSSGHLQIESKLEIAPGRGSNYIDFKVNKSNLSIPENGSTTSGDAWQRQIINPVKINTATWKRPPGRPSKGG
ncbi:MAG: hypothetical protein ACD_79C00637G0001, partial [uncultured bacterium]